MDRLEIAMKKDFLAELTLEVDGMEEKGGFL
jgi:hypothetical protein